MAIRTKRFTQHRFTTPKRNHYRRDGDFYKCYGLAPVDDGEALERMPTWSDPISFPATAAHVAAAFYDHDNDRRVFVDGWDNDGTDIQACYFDSSWTASSWSTIHASHRLGGLIHRNVQYWGGYLWLIDSDGDVQRGTSYTSALSAYETGDFRILWPIGDYMYAVDDNGVIYRSDETNTEFDSFYDPDTPLDIRWISAYRQYMLVLVRTDAGQIQLCRLSLSSPTGLFQLGTTLQTSGQEYSTLDTINYILHDDYFYFNPGWYTRGTSTKAAVLHSFNGAYIKQIARWTGDYAANLITWRGKLLAVQTYNGQHYIDQLIGDQFVRMLDTHADQSGYNHANAKVWNLGDELICTLSNPDDSGAAGFRHLGAGTFADGWIISSAYDMDTPARQKHLSFITVHTNTNPATDTDFKIKVSYRLDDDCHKGDSASWTTGITANGAARAVTAELDQEFYIMQVKVEIDDDSGSNLDRRIEAITVDYSGDT